MTSEPPDLTIARERTPDGSYLVHRGSEIVGSIWAEYRGANASTVPVASGWYFLLHGSRPIDPNELHRYTHRGDALAAMRAALTA